MALVFYVVLCVLSFVGNHAMLVKLFKTSLPLQTHLFVDGLNILNGFNIVQPHRFDVLLHSCCLDVPEFF